MYEQQQLVKGAVVRRKDGSPLLNVGNSIMYNGKIISICNTTKADVVNGSAGIIISIATIELAELPAKWCIKREPGNHPDINKHFISLVNKGYYAGKHSWIYSELVNGVSNHVFNNDEDNKSLPMKEGFTPITFEQFKEFVMKQPTKNEKKIIGYKCPTDLFSQRIKKGTTYVQGHDHSVYVINGLTGYHLPKEIVETWEPVYEKEDIEILIGNPSIRVIVCKDGVMIPGHNGIIDYTHIRNLLNCLSGAAPINHVLEANYKVYPTCLHIGCEEGTNIELKDIKLILETKKQL